jgi:hypothetical protein
MNQSQISDVFPEAKLYEVPGIERGSKRFVFGMKGFQIDRMKFEVRFYFDSDERLREVGLSPEGGETRIENGADHRAGQSDLRKSGCGPKDMVGREGTRINANGMAY